MRILHIHPSMAGGGIESMICGLANEMAKTEDITVCSIFVPNAKAVFWHKLSSAVTRVHLGKSKPGFSIVEIFKIFNFIRKGCFDVVNLHGFFYYYAFSILFLHRKVEFFYTVHSDANMENFGWEKRFFALKKRFFKWGWIHPITISHVSKDSFTQLYDIDSRLIYNGIPQINVPKQDLVEKFRVTPNSKIFIHAGRVSAEKNQVVLCKVFRLLIEQNEDVVLLIAGNIQDNQIYKTLELYFSERIVFLGERNDIPQLMAHCDAMCLPSIWEGLPVTLLESLSVGCIPICSPVGGIPNVIIDGENGFLSDTSQELDYYNKIKLFLSLPASDIERIKGKCINSFAKYDIKHTSRNYLEYYKNINSI